MNRRALLSALALPLASGCLLADFGSDAPGNDDAQPVSESRGPVRGEDDPIETRAVEDEEVEYRPDEDAVRYVARRRHTNHEEVEDGEPPEREPVYETVPWEEWAATQCRSAAGSAAAEHANAALGTDDVGGGITAGIEGRDVAAFVSIQTVLDWDGDVVHEPDVGFEALVGATPRTVHATYVLDGQEYVLDAPVYAEYSVMQYD